ncbi:MAG: hypothetical protein QM704_21725 [Anaeromyxobacteraceae bacterium]
MRNPKMMKLHEEIGELIAGDRHRLVEFLRKLHVLDRERGYCEFNCGSAWEYLTKVWHLCEGTAAGRVTAMRLIRRFPGLEAELETGRLNPTQLLVLASVLTPENYDELVAKAAWLSKRKTVELVVAIRPRDVPADGVRRLPRASGAASATNTATVSATATDAATAAVTDPAAPVQVNSLLPDMVGAANEVAPALVLSVPSVAAPVTPPRRADRGEVVPVAKDEYQLRAHMDEETNRLFDELAGLLANVVPDRAPAKLLAIMVRDSLEAQKRKRGLLKPTRVRKPAPAKEPTPGIRQPVLAEVRRAVLERDGYRCRFGEEEGHRCESTENLTMEHKDGALVTGSSTVDELLTYCFPHNLYAAFLKFGPEFIEQKIAEARAERAARRERASEDGGGEAPSNDDTPPDPVAGEVVAAYGSSPHAVAA